MNIKNDNLKKIWKQLLTYKKVATFIHKSPDGDSLGSCMAIKQILKKKNILKKNTRICSWHN